MYIFRCEDSLEGILSGVYEVYEQHIPREDAFLSLDEEPYLFSEERRVLPDRVKTAKVIRTLLERFGEGDFFELCMALSAPEADKAQAVFRAIACGLSGKLGRGHLLDNLADESVNRTFRLALNAKREYHHFLGFIRFEELENGILYSKIAPKNNIITFLMPHFADRFPGENFIIYDEGRKIFGIRPAGGEWYLQIGDEPEILNSRDELLYQTLFCHFVSHIAIKARENPVLQRNMLPLRYREYMTEFQQKNFIK